MSRSPRWVRPLSPVEVAQDKGQSKHKQQITCYRLGLSTRKPLKVDDVKAVLSALYWKVPTLRLCIQEKDGQLWFRELDDETIDLKVLKKVKNIDAEVAQQISTSFDSSHGPLWRVVITASSSKPCIEEIPNKYSNQYNLLISFHRAISDGFTNLRVTNLLLSLFNDVIAGKEIDTKQQLGELDDGAETARLVEERKQKLSKDPKWHESIQRQIEKCSQFRPLMFNMFPVPDKEKQNATHSICRSLDQTQTKRLLRFFKHEIITLTSGFIALANLQLVQMFRKRGSTEKMFEISSCVFVNLRRYWNKPSEGAFGCHVGSICLITDTPADSIQHFIEYAHDINTNLQDYIENKRALDEIKFLDFTKGTEHKSMDDFFTNPPEHHQIFHSTTNMGDVSAVLSGEGKYVQMSWLSRHNSFHRFNFPLINCLHTFRGRLFIGVDYNARCITKAVAEEYLNGICDLIIDIVNHAFES